MYAGESVDITTSPHTTIVPPSATSCIAVLIEATALSAETPKFLSLPFILSR